MREIVCFGDSNTWGFVPARMTRHPWSVRWTGRLQHALGEGYRIVEEGLCGRTTSFDDPPRFGLNGRAYLPIVLETHRPIDLLVIMLGTNDLKDHLNLSLPEIARGAESLLEYARGFEPSIPHILLVAPAHVVLTHDGSPAQNFDRAVEKSRGLAEHYRPIAHEYRTHFLDAASVIQSSGEDGIHLDEEAHAKLADALCVKVREILG